MILTEVLIPAIFFATLFGICYLFFTSRNRERMAMIEKGLDINAFKKDRNQVSFFTIFLLNVGLLAIGIGVAMLVGGLLDMIGVYHDIAYPSSILIFGGIALFIGFRMTKELIDKQSGRVTEPE